MITVESLEKQLNQKQLQPIYLFYGDEKYLIETNVKKIKNIFGECIKGINYILIDETNIKEIISDIETPSFGYSKKLIIAKNTGLLKKEGKRKTSDISQTKERLLKYLQENMQIIKESVVLVFIEEEVEKQELYNFLDKNCTVCKFDFQKPVQLIARLKSICNSYKVQVENYTLQYFIECCGTNMQELINEIRKLIEYAGPNGQIKNEDIDKLCIKKLESVIFDLTDSLGKRNIKLALNVLHNLIYEKEPIQKILITLYNHFKKLYLTSIAIQENKDVASSLSLKPNQVFLVNKYKMQSKYFNKKELRNILQALIDLDYNYKNGIIDLQLGLETVLCEYCS